MVLRLRDATSSREVIVRSRRGVVLRVLRPAMPAVDALTVADVPIVPLVGDRRVFVGAVEPVVEHGPRRETSRDIARHWIMLAPHTRRTRGTARAPRPY